GLRGLLLPARLGRIELDLVPLIVVGDELVLVAERLLAPATLLPGRHLPLSVAPDDRPEGRPRLPPAGPAAAPPPPPPPPPPPRRPPPPAPHPLPHPAGRGSACTICRVRLMSLADVS